MQLLYFWQKYYNCLCSKRKQFQMSYRSYRSRNMEIFFYKIRKLFENYFEIWQATPAIEMLCHKSMFEWGSENTNENCTIHFTPPLRQGHFKSAFYMDLFYTCFVVCVLGISVFFWRFVSLPIYFECVKIIFWTNLSTLITMRTIIGLILMTIHVWTSD